MQSVTDLLKKLPLIPILAAVGGLIFGLVIGWNTIEFKDATPNYLRADLREDYLRMTIDSYRQNGNLDLAVTRWKDLGPGAMDAFIAIQQDPKGADPAAISSYGEAIKAVLAGAPSTPQATNPDDTGSGTGVSSTIKTVITIGGILALMAIIIALVIFLRNLLGKRGGGEQTPAMQANEISRSVEKTNYEEHGIATPVTQTLSTYVLGDLYDEYFPINLPDGTFLGEFGAAIAHSIGVGENKKVTALEVWLFDPNNKQTTTKVLMSEHAYNDADIRARLEAKGDSVLMDVNNELLVETRELQLLVKVLDFEYGVGAFPSNSYFQRVTLELTVWQKSA